MIISIRTLINTTLFWAILLCGFRGYTRWLDARPAQELINAIGRNHLAAMDTRTPAEDSNTALIKKIDMIQSSISATQSICSSVPPIIEKYMNQSILNPITTINTATVTLGLLDNKSLTIIPVSRPLSTNYTAVWPTEAVSTLLSYVPTTSDQAMGMSNSFAGSSLSLINANVSDGTVTLTLSTPLFALSDVKKWLMRDALIATLRPFSEIEQLIITPAGIL